MNNPLDEFKKIFKGFGQKKEKSLLGVDIGSSAVKIVQMRESGGRAVLETYGSISLALYEEPRAELGEVVNLNEEQLVAAIQTVVKESNVTTNRAAFSIPSSSTLIFTITFPASIKETELKSMVPIEARRYIPIDINEVSLDWWLLPKPSFVTPSSPDKKEVHNETTVLVVAVRKDTVETFRGVMSRTELTQDFFEVESFSSVRASVEHDLSTNLVLDIGAARTKMVFMDGGIVRDVHVINRGGEDVTRNLLSSFNMKFPEAESIKKEYGLNNPDDKQRQNISESIDFIVAEMKNVIYRYSQKNGSAIDRIVLSGGASKLVGLQDYLSEKMATEVVFADPFSQAEAPEFLSGALKEAGPEFAVAVGLCLRGLKG
jgi:type IV pilus assembly protein PilM